MLLNKQTVNIILNFRQNYLTGFEKKINLYL